MKRKLTLILSLVTVLCFLSFVFVGCKSGGGESTTEPPQQGKEITFIDAPSTLYMGEIKMLTYVLSDGMNESNLTFESSNTLVATIDSTATVEALREGQTVITGKCDGTEAKITINVVKNDGIAQILFNNYIDETVAQTTTVNKKINFSGYVSYNGREFNDAEFTYSVDNPEIASITKEGVLTGLKNGTVTVKISATWRDMDTTLLEKEIVVNVVDEIQLLLEDGDISNIKLYSKAEHGNNTYETSYDFTQTARFIVNGEDLTSSTVFTIENNVATNNPNEEVASLNGKVITAVNYGTAKLVATTSDGLFSGSVEIVVNRPIYQYDQEIYFSQVDGDITNIRDMFGEEVTIVEAYQGGDIGTGTKLTVENNKITDYKLQDVNEKQTDVVCLYTEEVGVQVTVTAAKKVIRTAKDLTSLFSTSSSNVSIDGYFLVANDIAYDSTVKINPGHGWINSGSRFLGTLDGQGHTIEYGVLGGGLFGGALSGTVKDVELVIKSVPSSFGFGSHVFFANYLNNATIENVYARYDCTFTPNLVHNSEGFGLSAVWNNEGSSMIKNVILDLTNVTSPEINFSVNGTSRCGGAFGTRSSYTYPTCNNYNIIWGEKEVNREVSISDTAKTYVYGVASNESDYESERDLTGLTVTKKVLVGVYRYDTLVGLNGKTVGNFKVANGVVSWVK